MPNSFIHSYLTTSLVCISAPDEYTELECIIPYAISASLVWPALAWALNLKFESDSYKLQRWGKRRHRLFAGLDLLLMPAFVFANSISHSVIFTF